MRRWRILCVSLEILAGASATGGPGALIRGGFFHDGTGAGVFAVLGFITPSNALGSIGFRAAR